MGSMISAAAAAGMAAAQQQLVELGADVLVELTHTENTGFVTPGILECTNVTNFPDEEHLSTSLKFSALLILMPPLIKQMTQALVYQRVY